MTYLLPIFVGLCIVLQGTLNKQISIDRGLTWVVFVNGIVFFVVSLVVYLAVKFYPEFFPPSVRFKAGTLSPTWWWTLPGIFGFGIVFGIPLAIEKLGASRVFILVILSQIVFSLLWDTFIEKKPPSVLRITGATITLVGAALASI